MEANKPQIGIADLLTAIGNENITMQHLKHCMTDIKQLKGESKVTFVTQAITPGDVVGNTGPSGVIIWTSQDLLMERLEDLKAGRLQTMADVVSQRDELLSLLDGASKAISKAIPHLPADDEAIFCGEWLAEINEVIGKAKGGAA